MADTSPNCCMFSTLTQSILAPFQNLETLFPFALNHWDKREHNKTTIQTLKRFVCGENTTDPETETKSLDTCCLATGVCVIWPALQKCIVNIKRPKGNTHPDSEQNICFTTKQNSPGVRAPAEACFVFITSMKSQHFHLIFLSSGTPGEYSLVLLNAQYVCLQFAALVEAH